MEIVDRLLKNNKYIECLNYINELEKNRIYCKHNINHLVNVARIAYIIVLENNLNISKEIIYVTALLHDIGRWRQYLYNEDHALASAEIANNILNDLNFNGDINTITLAIKEHRKELAHGNQLSNVLYKSDKLSRLCFICNAQNTCNKFKPSMTLKKNNLIV